MRKVGVVYLQGLFYLIAGVNHFRDPQFYLGLIPDYLPAPEIINLLAGFVEVGFGLGLFFTGSRRWASGAIMLMLLAFIPSHIYFIQIGGCIPDGLCVPLVVGWIRLLVIHPFLIGWAWRAASI